MSKVVAAVLVVAAMWMPSQAFAQGTIGYSNVPSSGVSPSTTPAQQTTAPSAPATADAAVTTPSAPTQTQSSGTLPFTGLDVGIVVVVGLVLLGAGLVMRRAGAARSGR